MARVLLVFFLLGFAGSLVLAVEPEEVVGLEFMVGTLSGYAGGIGGGFVLASIFVYGAEGWEALGRLLAGFILGYTGGAALGASLGVAAVGSFFGVGGNLGLCFLGGAGGAGLVLGPRLITSWDFVFWFLPPAAAAGATAGFNVGARSR
ncbi:hypothetical protein H5T56_05900 [Candidatus Bipolaricaulota bacterium]|nr:hypothetical protein [Candidatus Bipolaricaulota bacterium]